MAKTGVHGVLGKPGGWAWDNLDWRIRGAGGLAFRLG